ncbi:hypothetical protein [Planococcus lenghuensis]|uniref:hypothetical protein n=1 Tax=Planococcus lenghuensis TaxID=2213202 RepID=UPI0012EC8A76|nr:hypothetical protein [Planococcus lenghuensis]
MPKRFNAFLSLISVLSISLITGVVSLQAMYYHAIIVDEIGLGGDPVLFFMTLATLLFGMLASALQVISQSCMQQEKTARKRPSTHI